MGRTNYSTKDNELAQKLTKEGCLIIATKTDLADGVKRYTFEESEDEINEILGISPKDAKKEKKAEKKAEKEVSDDIPDLTKTKVK